jgi:hypothetical protein
VHVNSDKENHIIVLTKQKHKKYAASKCTAKCTAKSLFKFLIYLSTEHPVLTTGAVRIQPQLYSMTLMVDDVTATQLG